MSTQRSVQDCRRDEADEHGRPEGEADRRAGGDDAVAGRRAADQARNGAERDGDTEDPAVVKFA